MILLAQGAKTRVVACPDQSCMHLRCALTIYVNVYEYKTQVAILRMVCQSLLFWRNKPKTSNWCFQTTYSEHPMEKSVILPISSISSNFFQKKLEEIGIFQFPPGVPEEIHFFQKKNNPVMDEGTFDARVTLYFAKTFPSFENRIYSSSWQYLNDGN